MKISIRSQLFFLIVLCLLSCSKEDDQLILQDKYDAELHEASDAVEDFTVDLNARPLQPGETGEWKILEGSGQAELVALTDKASPFSKFKGIPGEVYTLEWTRKATNGTLSSVKTTVKIPLPKIEILDNTSGTFQTILTLNVNPKYRGTWSFDIPYGHINSRYHDGRSEPIEKKPSIELHGYANKSYNVTFTYAYGGKTFVYSKVVKTGDYTEDEALFELNLTRDSYGVYESQSGNIEELYLQASGIGWIFNESNTYPALSAFKKIKRLTLGGSSLRQIPEIFGDHYQELDYLDMMGVGQNLLFPNNFGNLKKLRTLKVSPRFSSDGGRLTLPKSFINLKSLEYFETRGMGAIDFNGTMGGLTNLKKLNTPVAKLPEDIGDLKKLEHIDVLSTEHFCPQRISECRSLKFLRINCTDNGDGTMTLPIKFGDLKQLEYLDLYSVKLYQLPASFGNLSSLKVLRITARDLQSLPENFGSLLALEDILLYGMLKEIPESFGNLKNLTNLNMSTYAETLPESFGNLSNLTYFNASSSELRTLPKSIGKLKKLKEIALGLSKIESLPDSFSELDALETLNLSNTKLQSFPRAILGLKSITAVMLSGTNTGDIPEDFSKIKPGVNFTFYQIANLTLEHLKKVLMHTKQIVFYTSFGYQTSPV